MNSVFFLALLAGFIAFGQSTIILRPVKVSSFQAGLIFIQGAEIPAINYANFSRNLQLKFNGSLWVALLEFPLNIADPLQIGSLVSSALVSFKAQGFNFSTSTPFFFGGHSLGGVVLINYLVNNFSSLSNLISFRGTFLEGSFVPKKILEKSQESSFPPVLTLGAELDGLARISRMAQAYYYDVRPPTRPGNSRTNKTQTIVINGMNHFQFVGSGKPTPTIIRNDIPPEIDTAQAQDLVTSVVVAFLDDVLDRRTPTDDTIFEKFQLSTIILLQPIIDGLLNEGFYDFWPPCYLTPDLQPPLCWAGSPYTPFAQSILGSLNQSHLFTTDTFRPAAKIPEHFPSLKGNCSKTPPEKCTLNVLSYTENIYSLQDQVDNGLWPVAAEEARTKMVSRQRVQEAYTGKKFDFNQTDGGNLCAQINQATIDWALKTSPVSTVQRYLNKGKLLKPGNDIDYKTGSSWLSTKLKFDVKQDANNRTFIDLRSPTLRFPTNYVIKAVAGLHYCKLLTTGRALEWIYVDSVKP